MHTDERLREIHVGSWEGLTIDDLLGQIDGELKRAYLAGEDVRRSPTGETVAEVGERAGAALGEIGLAAPDGSTVVVVMHGVAARAGVCRLVGFPAETWHRLSGLHNCGWISVERHRTGGRDQQLAVDDETLLRNVGKHRGDLREVAGERLARLRP